MRRFGKVTKNRWLFAAFAFALVTLSSCQKDDDNGVFQVSAVRALNAVPGSDQLDLGLNDSWLNYDLQTEQIEDFAYRDTLPYKRAWPGIRVVRVFEGGNITNSGLLAQENVQFYPGQFYSIYVVGREDDVELMVTEDDLSAPGEGKAKIRFINLSPDAPALDFGIEGAGDAVMVTDQQFKEVSDFVAIDSGEAYTFNFKEHSNGKLVHTFEFTPKEGLIYTIWVRGLFENEGNAELKLGHDIIVH
ncbi:hypothetical protein GCM10011386_13220 [Parapedobacter defluvii]|uniref:DUF4397 domain-containing protein n=1 Tax=Parapedobacter defluvii TaxID=2045106 RepID=A0ABQ1LC95_9SPHI|nr:DUF4397 domain-containing protein [Parapedobacter defluvii]RQP19384.1 MAG: DUF4397 domain-containing protein [Parapedobacter sp.]GGC22695.1 hypothetical protein GCM10011386_13220 [Parapedobacter defluvii]